MAGQTGGVFREKLSPFLAAQYAAAGADPVGQADLLRSVRLQYLVDPREGHVRSEQRRRHFESGLTAMFDGRDLQGNLSAAAHLIHGSSEDRFKVTYCPGHLSREEIESVGYEYADLADAERRYDPKQLHDGWNTLPDGERVYYISNPALGLWAYEGRLR
jgi:hypothetical protein